MVFSHDLALKEKCPHSKKEGGPEGQDPKYNIIYIILKLYKYLYSYISYILYNIISHKYKYPSSVPLNFVFGAKGEGQHANCLRVREEKNSEFLAL